MDQFKNKGIFEVKDDERLIDVINYSGGISSFGLKEKLFIKRNDGLFKKIEDVDKSFFSNYTLNDGDTIEARPVTDIFTNLVSIEGAVNTPGDYSIENGRNVESLIMKAGGLKDYAITERAYLIRKENGVESKIVSFNLIQSKTIDLKPNDKIIISSNGGMTTPKFVSIKGEVTEPNNYPFDGMTLIDLILISKDHLMVI